MSHHQMTTITQTSVLQQVIYVPERAAQKISIIKSWIVWDGMIHDSGPKNFMGLFALVNNELQGGTSWIYHFFIYIFIYIIYIWPEQLLFKVEWHKPSDQVMQ